MDYPVRILAEPDTVRLVSSARLRDPVLAHLVDDERERLELAEIEGATSGRLTAGRRGTASIAAGEFVQGVPHAAFVNAAFAYFRPREPNRFNGPERGAWYAALAVETCIAEIAWHLEREFRRIGEWTARIESAELFASFAGSFVDLRELATRPPCLDPAPANGYPAGNALAAEVRAAGHNGIVYPSVRHPGGTNLVALFPHAVQSVRQGRVLELSWSGSPGAAIRVLGG